MKASKLAAGELQSALASLPGWRAEGEAIVRDWTFRDFVEAFAFMTAAALKVQEMDHHPEWSNVYNSVRVRLTTHDSGGVTARDVELATKMEALAKRLAND